MSTFLMGEPVEHDGAIHFTLNIRGRLQRYAITEEALTDLARGTEVACGDKLQTFRNHRHKIFRVAERWLVGPSTGTIVLVTGVFQ